MTKVVYDRIKDNKKKIFLLAVLSTLLLFVLFSIFLYALLGIFTPDRFSPSLIIASIATLAAVLTATYCDGTEMMLSLVDAERIQRPKKDDAKTPYAKVFGALESVALAAGLPTPSLHVIHDSSLNAFSVGNTPKEASIVLSTGLIQALTPLELEAVIAHEMAHIGNQDTRLNVFLITKMGLARFLDDKLGAILDPLITKPSEHSSNFLWKGDEAQGKQFLLMLIVMTFLAAIAFVLKTFDFFFSRITRRAISKTAEYNADAKAAVITRNPGALADALRKINVDPRIEVLDYNPRMAIACIVDSRDVYIALRQGISHPTVRERIKLLNTMAGRA